MCGIAGIINFSEDSPSQTALVKSAVGCLNHRGPDAHDIQSHLASVLGHARLSIIDQQTGAQPMWSHDRRFLLTYNGEIYNYLELRDELIHKGAKFETHSDTEVIIEAYRYWGSASVNRFNGMWSFVLLDTERDVAFASRDPYGQKPFYFTQSSNQLKFASELKALKVLEPSLAPTPQTIAQFLRFEAFHDGTTIYESASKLPPGHSIEFSKSGLKVWRYFVNPMGNEHGLPIRELRTLLLDSVELTYKSSDVPVALLLSGGLDSSLVLAMLKALRPGGNLEAFHLRTSLKSLDESSYAIEVAKHLGVRLNIQNLDNERLSELAAQLPTLLDEPQADPGLLAKYEISRVIGERFKVALTGDGGDEFFMGYIVFKAEKLARFLRSVPSPIINGLIKPLAQTLPSGFGYMPFDFMVKNFLKGFPGPDSLRASKWMQSFSNADLKNLLVTGMNDSAAVEKSEQFIETLYQSATPSDGPNRLAFLLQGTYLPDYVLPNSDRAAMLNSVELRAPLLDTRLVRFLNQYAGAEKIKGLNLKSTMKTVATEYLPSDCVYRKKMGFTVPLAALMKDSFTEEFARVFDRGLLQRQGLFKPDSIWKMVKRHQDGKENLYKPLWTLYSLQNWLVSNGYGA